MVKKCKLKQDLIFSLSFSHIHCPKQDHSFTFQPTRGLADSLAPRAIHLASWPSVLETPIEHNNDARVSYVYSSKSSQTLPTLPTSHPHNTPNSPIPSKTLTKYLKKRISSSNLKSSIYKPQVIILLLIHQ